MRLLNTETLQLQEFFEDDIPFYAILSHRWDAEEITFKDVTKRRNLENAGWKKVRDFCKLASSMGYEWAWVDTCCIDKRSSAELSEAINSMYRWYQDAHVCIIYLNDVECEPSDVRWGLKRREINLDGDGIGFKTSMELRKSRWFTRCWTLQELLAPSCVYFVDQHWNPFGSKHGLMEILSEITGIKNVSLNNVNSESVAAKMSWASKRECTRPEDMAYCLMGLFRVNMPLLYGEGGTKAFRRLQLEILRESNDESIFAWWDWDNRRYMNNSMLAATPKDFQHSSAVRCFIPNIPRGPFLMTNNGLQIKAIILTVQRSDGSEWLFLPLNCYKKGQSKPLAIPIGCWGPGRYYRHNGLAGQEDFLNWPNNIVTRGRQEVSTIYFEPLENNPFSHISRMIGKERHIYDTIKAELQSVIDQYQTSGEVRDGENGTMIPASSIGNQRNSMQHHRILNGSS